MEVEQSKERSSKDQRMKQVQEDQSMKDERRKRERDQREEEDSEDQAKKYATIVVEEESINSILWTCSLSNNQEYYDDVTGKLLNKELVLKARIQQLGEVKKFDVYHKVPIQQCWNETGKNPIAVRWLDVNPRTSTFRR